MNGGSGRGAAPARLRISRDFTSASAQLTAAQYRGPSSRPDPARRTTPLPPTLLALSLSLSVSPPLSLVSTGDRLLLFLSLYLLSFLVETSISSTSYVLLGLAAAPRPPELFSKLSPSRGVRAASCQRGGPVSAQDRPWMSGRGSVRRVRAPRAPRGVLHGGMHGAATGMHEPCKNILGLYTWL